MSDAIEKLPPPQKVADELHIWGRESKALEMLMNDFPDADEDLISWAIQCIEARLS